jgi:hypothetical protein
MVTAHIHDGYHGNQDMKLTKTGSNTPVGIS